MWTLKYLLLLTFMACIMAESIFYKTCEVNDCDISEIIVDPCARDNEKTACIVRRRKQGKIYVTFAPKFDADSLEAKVFWVKDAESDLPLISLDTNACNYTKCPAKSGQSQQYSIEIPLENKFPLGTYKVKWTIKAPSGKQCCFTHEIKLVR